MTVDGYSELLLYVLVLRLDLLFLLEIFTSLSQCQHHASLKERTTHEVPKDEQEVDEVVDEGGVIDALFARLELQEIPPEAARLVDVFEGGIDGVARGWSGEGDSALPWPRGLVMPLVDAMPAARVNRYQHPACQDSRYVRTRGLVRDGERVRLLLMMIRRRILAARAERAVRLLLEGRGG